MDYEKYINNLKPSHWKSIGFLTLAEWAFIGVHAIYNNLDYNIYLELSPSVILGGLSAYAYGIELSKKSSELNLKEKIKEED